MDGYFQSTEDRRRLNRVLAIVSRMPRKRREAIILFAMERLNYKEMGLRLGLSVPDVKRHICRALEDCARPE